jgi:hypothetical protein
MNEQRRFVSKSDARADERATEDAAYER